MVRERLFWQAIPGFSSASVGCTWTLGLSVCGSESGVCRCVPVLPHRWCKRWWSKLRSPEHLLGFGPFAFLIFLIHTLSLPCWHITTTATTISDQPKHIVVSWMCWFVQVHVHCDVSLCVLVSLLYVSSRSSWGLLYTGPPRGAGTIDIYTLRAFYNL